MSKSFISITQTGHLQNFDGPSGQKYESLQGRPFKVENDQDIAFFESKPTRFKVAGLFTKGKTEKSADKLLAEWLGKLKVSPEGIDAIVKTFETKDFLKTDVLGGADLLDKVSEADAELIRDAIKQEGA